MSVSSEHSERGAQGRAERRSTDGQGDSPVLSDSRSSKSKNSRRDEIAQSMDDAKARFARTSQNPSQEKDGPTPLVRREGARVHFRKSHVNTELGGAAKEQPADMDQGEE